MSNRQSGRFRISETPERGGEHSAATSPKGGQGGSTAAVLWIGLPTFGFLVLGAGLMFIADDATVGSRIYTSTPQFKVWAALMIGLVASLPVVWRVGLDLLRRLGLDPLSALRSKALPVLAGVILVVAAAPRMPDVLFDHGRPVGERWGAGKWRGTPSRASGS